MRISARRVHLPESVEEARAIVRSRLRVRPLGSRHCFNRIADTTEEQISLERLKAVVALSEKVRTVTVESGVLYGELCPWLHEQGWALHNLASLPHISIAGACATATHGSGAESGNLATAVRAVELIDASGATVRLSREKDGDAFAGAVVGLGALGPVTQLTLEVQPAFDMTQHAYLDLPVGALYEHFDDMMAGGYSVSLFTDWQTDTVNQVWVKRRVGGVAKDLEALGARPADRNVHPILALSAESCTEQMGVRGPWYERLPHFRMDFTPSSGKELQSEYFVPREHAPEVARRLYDMGDAIGPLLMISEVRSVAGNDLWMSTAQGGPRVAFPFMWEQDWAALRRLLPSIEEALEPFGARLHWGKLFLMPRERLGARYDRLADFRDLVRSHDPGGKFRNAFLSAHVL